MIDMENIPVMGYDRRELLQMADAVASEKAIEREEVLTAMEAAIQRAAEKKYGEDHDVRAVIDRRTGDIKLARYLEVVDEIENEITQVTTAEAQHMKAGAVAGDFIVDPLPPIDFGRIAAQTAKQVIVQTVREAERRREYEEFKDRVGEIVSGLIKRIDYGHIVVDLGRGEGTIRRGEGIPREPVSPGDRIRAYIYDVRREERGPQVLLSRSHPQFMAMLFAQEVPEIYDGIIEIKSVARDPGSRAKIAVLSNDSGIDPVGACVGMRGSRVQAVVGELQGEKIDIIQWSPDAATFIVNALAPAEVSKVVLDEDNRRIEVVMPDDQLSFAIGRRGQNVRLASQLTQWEILILTEDEESERRQEEFRTRSQAFMDGLEVDDVLAHLLVAEGFATIEDVAFVPLDDLLTIEGFDESIAEELRSRAQVFLEEEEERLQAERRELGVEDGVAAIPELTAAMVVALGKAGIRTLDDLGDLATDELVAHGNREGEGRGLLADFGLDVERGEAVIMAARAHWFDDDDQDAENQDAGEQDAEDSAAPVEQA